MEEVGWQQDSKDAIVAEEMSWQVEKLTYDRGSEQHIEEAQCAIVVVDEEEKHHSCTANFFCSNARNLSLQGGAMNTFFSLSFV